MYKVFLKYPESLRPAFPRLKEKLEDPDPGNKPASLFALDSLKEQAFLFSSYFNGWTLLSVCLFCLFLHIWINQQRQHQLNIIYKDSIAQDFFHSFMLWTKTAPNYW